MFIGHYGVALAAKRLSPHTPLGALFVAVQLLDVILALLLLARVEHLHIVPGFTRVTPYDFSFIPYSHSLVGAVLWSALSALGCGLLMRAKPRARVAAALVFGGTVLSHFVFDIPVHLADLPLGFEASSPKIGLALWNQPGVTIALELGLLVIGGVLYLGVTRPRLGNGPTLIAGCTLVAIAVATPFLPVPSDVSAVGPEALGGILLLAALGEWMDRSRTRI